MMGIASDHFIWKLSNRTSGDVDKIAYLLSTRLSLEFISENQRPQTNLCFVESDEVRDEFRITFNTSDILNYVFAIQQVISKRSPGSASGNPDVVRIGCPKNSSAFWKIVKLGNKLRKSSTSEFSALDNWVEEIEKTML